MIVLKLSRQSLRVLYSLSDGAITKFTTKVSGTALAAGFVDVVSHCRVCGFGSTVVSGNGLSNYRVLAHFRSQDFVVVLIPFVLTKTL